MTKKLKDSMNYDEIITNAMRGALGSIFEKVEKEGMVGDHHFVITFLTGHKNTVLSKAVKEIYPNEITIILQHQFHNLKAKKKHFEVELSFGGVPEIICVPYDAIVSFSDPSVNFELIFDDSTPPEKEGDGGGNFDIKNNLIDFDSLLKNKGIDV